MSYNENILNWLATVGIGTTVIIQILINSSIVHSILQTIRTKPIPKRLIFVSLITTFSFLLTDILLFVSTTFALIKNDNTSKTSTVHSVGYIGFGLYLISQTFMIFIFTIRVDFAFRNSALSYSKRTIKILYAASISMLIFCFVMVISLILDIWSVAYIGGVIWILLYFTLAAVLVALFMRKIEFAMIKTHKLESPRSHSSNASSDGDDNIQILKSMIDNELLYVAVKHSLLIPIAICSSMICFFIAMGINYMTDPDAVHATAGFWFSFDSVVTSMCTHLLLAANDNRYNKICFRLHRACENRKLSKMEHSNEINETSQSV